VYGNGVGGDTVSVAWCRPVGLKQVPGVEGKCSRYCCSDAKRPDKFKLAFPFISYVGFCVSARPVRLSGAPSRAASPPY
jgi:hypothetical protein